MPKKSAASAIDLFIESVDQVLNSNTAYIQLELPTPHTDIAAYIKAIFVSGKFYEAFTQALDWQNMKYEKSIPNIEIELMPVSFAEFKNILVDMLAVKRVYFHDSPYKVQLSEKTIQHVVDNFTEYVINSENAEPYSKNIKHIEARWKFYSMPRDHVNSEKRELEFLQNKNGHTYRPMSEVNNNNFLGKYFCNLGLDSFLVFHNGKTIFFLLTNGGD